MNDKMYCDNMIIRDEPMENTWEKMTDVNDKNENITTAGISFHLHRSINSSVLSRYSHKAWK